MLRGDGEDVAVQRGDADAECGDEVELGGGAELARVVVLGQVAVEEDVGGVEAGGHGQVVVVYE